MEAARRRMMGSSTARRVDNESPSAASSIVSVQSSNASTAPSVASAASTTDSISARSSVASAAPTRPRAARRIIEDSDEEEERTRPAARAVRKIIQDSDEEDDTTNAETASEGSSIEEIYSPPPRASRFVPDDSDDSDVVEVDPPFPVARPAQPPKGPSFPTPQISKPPSFPTPQPYRPPQTAARPQARESTPSSAPLSSGKTYNPVQVPRVKKLLDLPTPPATVPATPIEIPKTGTAPSRSAPTLASSSRVANEEDYYDAPASELNQWETPKSAEDVQSELQELFSGTIGVEDTPIDMSDAIVPGLAEGVTLKAHQVVSRAWMRQREEGKKRGGILADDMGLGKTLQTIVRIIDGRAGDKHQAPTLVVTPTSVVTQWVEEIKRYAPRIRAIEHHGTARTRDPSVLERAHVVVTSYTVVLSEHKAHYGDGKEEGATPVKKKGSKKKKSDSDDETDDDAEHFGRVLQKAKAPAARGKKKAAMDALHRIEWHRVVLDEAHTIKNRLAQTTKACWALKSDKRWCLTGTPMQNGVEELFPLLHFIGVRPFNSWDTFNDQVAKPVKAGKTGNAMKRLHVVLKSIMLRRLKTDMINGKALIELPARHVEIIPCEFDDEERAFYTALEEKIELTMNKFMAAGTVMNNYTAVLTLLLRLRQACNHPGLVTKDFSKDKEALESRPVTKVTDDDGGDALQEDPADDLIAGLAKLAVSASIRTCSICQSRLDSGNSSPGENTCNDCAAQLARQQRRTSLVTSNSSLPPSSAKIRKVLELLRRIRDRGEGEKTIIFSQFTSWLDLFDPFLREEGMKFVRLDGSMAKPERQESLRLIRENKKVNIILVSFKAGSTGLNLVSCNHVILVDLWWNPALEEQAFDRAHRLGQQRDVKIYKLTIEKTVEDRILALQDKKRELAKAALSGDKVRGNKLALDDIMALFRRGADDDD